MSNLFIYHTEHVLVDLTVLKPSKIPHINKNRENEETKTINTIKLHRIHAEWICNGS